MAEQHSGVSLRERHEEKVLEAKAVIRRLEKDLSSRKYKKVSHLIDLVSQYYVLREHPKYTMMKIFALYRKHIISPFETFEEQEKGGCDSEVLDERRRIYEQAHYKSTPLAMLSNGQILKPSRVDKEGDIQGFGISGGGK